MQEIVLILEIWGMTSAKQRGTLNLEILHSRSMEHLE
jgi:hypothetical protein